MLVSIAFVWVTAYCRQYDISPIVLLRKTTIEINLADRNSAYSSTHPFLDNKETISEANIGRHSYIADS